MNVVSCCVKWYYFYVNNIQRRIWIIYPNKLIMNENIYLNKIYCYQRNSTQYLNTIIILLSIQFKRWQKVNFTWYLSTIIRLHSIQFKRGHKENMSVKILFVVLAIVQKVESSHLNIQILIRIISKGLMEEFRFDSQVNDTIINVCLLGSSYPSKYLYSLLHVFYRFYSNFVRLMHFMELFE